MAVYASKRSESKMEFINVAQQLAVYTLDQVKKFPKSRNFRYIDRITDLAFEIHEDVTRANSYYVYKDMMEFEFIQREVLLFKAKSAIFTMSSLLTITFSYVKKGNNFLGDMKKMSNMFKEWARLLNYETALIKGIIESDKKRYKRYNKPGTSKKLEKILNQQFEDENEIVLPESTFDIEDTAE